MTNIKQVAKIAGVSIKTVSRVINNNPEVAEETRQRVRQVIDQLDYRPNMLARGLVNGKANAVGVVIHHSAHEIFTYPVFSDALKGIAKVLSDHRLDLLLHLAHGAAPYIDLYRQHRADGLILMSLPLNDPHLDGLIGSNMPFVSTCRLVEDDAATTWVEPDFFDGTIQIVDHLVALGHRRIGLLAGPADLGSARLRVKGFHQRMAEHGIPVNESLIVYGDLFQETGRRLAEALMRRELPPTALICSDDLVALEAIQRLQELGYRVPDDVSVVGCDDAIIARYATPALTTIRQDSYMKGYLAATRLIERMAGSPPTALPTQTLLEMNLIVRDSTGPVNS